MNTTLQIHPRRAFWDHIVELLGVFAKISIWLPRVMTKKREVLNPEIERERLVRAACNENETNFHMICMMCFTIR